MAAERPLTPAEWSVLALLCEEPAHGWAVGAALAPGGEIGIVWSVTRPLVYRAIAILDQRGLVEVAGPATSAHGPSRIVYRPTERGRHALADWLARPVAHVRDVRPDLLLKLVFARRSRVDTAALLAAQRSVVEKIVQGLSGKLVGAGGGGELLVRYQVETAQAALRFIEAAAGY